MPPREATHSWLAPLLDVDPALSGETRAALRHAWTTEDIHERKHAQREAARLLRAAFDLTCEELGELVGAADWHGRALPCGG